MNVRRLLHLDCQMLNRLIIINPIRTITYSIVLHYQWDRNDTPCDKNRSTGHSSSSDTLQNSLNPSKHQSFAANPENKLKIQPTVAMAMMVANIKINKLARPVRFT